MRNIGLEDVFAWSEIIDKLDIEEDIAKIQLESVDKEDAEAYAGVRLMALLFTKMYKVKDLIIEWLASLTGKSLEESKKLSFKEMKGYITEFMESEELTELFTSLVTKPKS